MSYDDLSNPDVLRHLADKMEATEASLARLRAKLASERRRADAAEMRWETWSGRDAAVAAEAAMEEARRVTQEWSERTLYRPSEVMPGWVLTMTGYGRIPVTCDGWLSVYLHTDGSWAWGLGVHGVRAASKSGFGTPQAAATDADAVYPQEAP